MKKSFITLLVSLVFVFGLALFAPKTHADTPINITSFEYLSCSPDCQTLRVHFDSYSNYSSADCLINTDSSGNPISGAYCPADFTDTYADFTVANNNPVWDQYMGIGYYDGSNFVIISNLIDARVISPTPTPTDTPTPTATPTPNPTPINITSFEYLSCSPDCQTLRVHFDSYSNYSSADCLINTDSSGNPISGAYCPADFTNTYADFTVANNNPVWDQYMGIGYYNGSNFVIISNLIDAINPTYSITGNVFNDANHNGVQDNGEGGYQGATVTLSGAASASTTTDTNGNYTFSGLYSGSYTETVTPPTGYGATTSNPVNVTLTSNTTENFGITTTTKVTLTPLVDTFVNSNAPTTNYGTLDKLTVEGSPVKTSYLKYDLSSLAGKTITSVKFKVTTYTDANSTSNGPDYVYLANSNTWGETTMNYNNQVGVSSTLLGTLTNLTSLDTEYSFTLDPSGVQAATGSRLSLGITTSTDQLHIFSREAANSNNEPKLVIEYY